MCLVGDGEQKACAVFAAEELVAACAEADQVKMLASFAVAAGEGFDGFEGGGVHDAGVVELEVDRVGVGLGIEEAGELGG